MENHTGKTREQLEEEKRDLTHSRNSLLEAQQIAYMGSWDWDIVQGKGCWSPGLYRIFGCRPGEVSPGPRSFLQFVHPRDREMVREALDRAVGQGIDFDLEHRYTKGQGEEGWLYSRGRVESRQGEPVRLKGMIQEITGRKQVELMLEEEKNFSSAIIDTIGSLVAVLNPRGQFVRFNRACQEFTGLTWEEARGKYYWDVFCLPEEAELCKAFFNSLDPGGYPYQLEACWTAPRGCVHTILWVNTALVDEEGNIKHHIMTGTDLTGRKKAEEALREMGENYRALIHASPVAVISLDCQGRVRSWSSAAERILGWTEREVLGQGLSRFLEDPRGTLKLLYQKALEGKSSHNIEKCFTPRDGSLVHLNLSLAPLRDSRGIIEGAMLVANDVTDRRRAEDSLKEERKKARHIHQQSLPEDFPGSKNYFASALYRPAPDMRGDFYNFLKSGDSLVFYLVDVAGEGLDGVMLSGFVKKALEEYLAAEPGSRPSLGPAGMLRYLFEQHTCSRKPGECMLRIFLGVLDLSSGELKYASRGYREAPLAVQPDGRVGRLQLEGSHPGAGGGKGPAALFPGLPSRPGGVREESCWEGTAGMTGPGSMPGEFTVPFPPGVAFLFFTDGLLKVPAPGGEGYRPRLEGLLSRCRTFPPEIILRELQQEIGDPGNGPPAEDDIVCLVLQAVPRECCLTLELESDFSMIPRVVQQVQDFITSSGIPLENDLLEFHEMLVNAVEHGNKRDWGKKVVVEAVVAPRYYKIVITDQGEGFDWQERLERPLDMEGHSERGRGIIMTDLMCDFLQYNRKGNRVTLINLVQPG